MSNHIMNSGRTMPQWVVSILHRDFLRQSKFIIFFHSQSLHKATGSDQIHHHCQLKKSIPILITKWLIFPHKITATLHPYQSKKTKKLMAWNASFVEKWGTSSNVNSAIRIYFVFLVMTCIIGIQRDKLIWGRWVDMK